MLTIKYEGKAVQSALARMLAAIEQSRPLLMMIGQDLAESTMQRFETGRPPGGTPPWAEKSAVTIAVHPRGGTKPLIGENRILSTTIASKVQGNTIRVGSNAKQAAVLQFGAPAGSLGRGIDKRGRRFQTPWGDIPPRPYLGVSPADESHIMELIQEYLRMN
jgi:phage virion morphogenesis protein